MLAGVSERYAVRGTLLVDGELVPGAVVVDGARIEEVVRGDRIASERLPARVIDAALVAPGFVELQINGGFGIDLIDGGDAIARLADALPATGVTSFLPTLVSSPAATYLGAFDDLARAACGRGAEPLGLHLEGPFLAASRRGAHDPAPIAAADDAMLDAWIDSGAVRLVTLAPERAGGLARIARLCAGGIAVSVGHTDATYDEVSAAIDAGARLVTHLYNAMSPLGHRAPGAVGAALTDDRVAVGLIADGVHCHPAALRLALRAKGAARIALTTDAMAAAAMPTGRYTLGSQAVAVDETGARLDDGTLAGSVLTMDRAVRNMVTLGGASIADALTMATAVPARVLGLTRKGRLAPGADADLVLLDDHLQLEGVTLLGGHRLK